MMLEVTVKRILAVALGLALSAAALAQFSKYKDWDKTPEAYFLTPAERAEWKKVTSDADAETFICGPDPYLALVREALRRLDAKGVHVERFVPLAENPFEVTEPTGGTAATLEVCLDGQTRRLPWPAGTRMLDVLIDEGLDAPYSCREGICGACACQLTGGEVEMAHNEVLEAEDLAEGYVLACQSLALTPEVSITYS